MEIKNNFSINHKAGMTKKIQTEINSCDITRISHEFSRNKINTDFKNNKIIAWCSFKSLEIIIELNKRFQLNLPLPKAIFVENFDKLRLQIDPNAIGLCNVAPTLLFKDSNLIIPEKTIVFNSDDSYWNNLDDESNRAKANGISPTDFFLSTFLHEFSHVIHINNLLKIYDGKKILELLYNIPDNMENFKDKYWYILGKNCCTYAGSNPMEAIACDLEKRISNCIDKNTLHPINNFIENSPYRKLSIKEKIFRPFTETKYDKAIRNFWNGNFK